MKAEYNDFIGHYPSLIPRSACNALIASMEGQRSAPWGLMTRTSQIGRDRHLISDQAIDMFHIDLSYSSDDVSMVMENLKIDLPEAIDMCVEDYFLQYSAMHATVGGTSFNKCFKMQCSVPGEGYNVWHSEWTVNNANRLLVWILYLNDIEDGGETEFLYYPQRFQPRAGDLIVWPSGFTHTHRGNPPLKDKKYIMTGWITQN